MIKEFVEKWEECKPSIEEDLKKSHPETYTDLVRLVVEHIGGAEEEEGDCTMDPERITVIDHGHYQGTLVFVIGETGYQPSRYWAVRVFYGSCSGCDTLCAIREYSDDPPTPEQVKDYMTLALHIVQGLKALHEE